MTEEGKISVYETAYRAGRTFDEFLAAVEANRELWHAMASRARIDPDLTARLRTIPGEWRLLILADDWCGDAVNILPVVARLVEDVAAVDIRIVGREEIEGLMDRHLTDGSRSIPVIVLLDHTFSCRGWWGPRPAGLQAWFQEEGRYLPKPDRYRELRRRYARDRGAAIATEITDLIETADFGSGCERTGYEVQAA